MYNIKYIDTVSPSRGWYSLFPFVLSEKVDFDELKWSLKSDEVLVLARINLNEFREKPISDEALKNLKCIFNFFRKHRKEIILRFTYDVEGKGLMNEPESIKIIKGHIAQLGPVIADNSDVIYAMQGIFTGSWGEMHTSRYDNDTDVPTLVIKLFEATSGKVRLSLRKVSHVKALITFLDTILYEKKKELLALTGLYDDAILASDNDMGTFNPETVEDDLRLVGELACFSCIGGECVNDNPLNNGAAVIEGLKARNVTYLNSQYDDAVLSKWKKLSSGFGDESVYDYVTKHLGYRFEYAGIKAGVFSGNAVISVKNTGFAPFYGALVMRVQTQDGDNVITAVSQEEIVGPGKTVGFKFEKKMLGNELTVSLVRKKDGKLIGIL